MISNFFSSLFFSMVMLSNTSVTQSETNPNECTLTPIVEGKVNVYDYELEGEIPDYLENVVVKNACEPDVLYYLTYNDKAVNYLVERDEPYPLTINALDIYGNSYEIKSFVKVSYDITAPEIKNFKDLTIEINSEPNYLNGITVNDNKDLEPSLTFDASKVDLTKLGEYDLIYRAEDADGNVKEEKVKVAIVDTIKPEVTGNRDLEFEVKTQLSLDLLYEGIVTNDNSKLIVDKQIIGFEAINTGQLGSYLITYKFTDVGGNFVEFEHRVDIVDTTQPTITLNNPIRYKLGQGPISYKDYLLIEDNYDELVYNDVLIFDKNVQFEQPGYYKVHFFVSDMSGNNTTLTADLVVFDEDIPTFNGLKDLIEIPLNSNSIDYLSGVIVNDATDGIITDKVIIYDDLVNVNKLGNYKVYYMVYDSSNNRAIEEVTVRVYDNKKPEIIGLKDLVLEVKTYTAEGYDFLAGIEATDDYDTNLQVSIQSNDVNFEVLGTYTVTYIVVDSSLNETIESITVQIVDTTKPTLVNIKDLTLKIGEVMDLKNNLRAVDNYDGDINDQIKLIDADKVNFNVAGEYEVRAEVTDSSGNIAYQYFKVTISDNPQKVEPQTTNPLLQLDEKILYVLGAMVAIILVGVSVQVIRRKSFKKK
jgi:hypothetical protein